MPLAVRQPLDCVTTRPRAIPPPVSSAEHHLAQFIPKPWTPNPFSPIPPQGGAPFPLKPGPYKLYSASGQLYRSLGEKGIAPNTPEWKEQVEAYLVQARKTMEGRLRPDIPARRYVCFYPMDKKRGEEKNWYDAPFAERQRMMQDHGFIGRGYAGRVTQIISGSIGFDDWEWGVDLFADDPVVFKKLVYEMRFDEASALYGLFGPFYMGLQFRAEELGALLEGRTPGFPANG